MSPLGPTELQKLTVAKLRAMAKELGMTGYSAMIKAELVKAVADAQTKATKTKTPEKAKISPKTKKTEKEKPETIKTKTAQKSTPKKSPRGKTPVPIDNKKKTTTTEDELTPVTLTEEEEIKKKILTEPTHIYIDRGHPIPEYCPGTRLRVLVRDPGTLFVYWDCDFESHEGWFLTAFDSGNNVMAQFHSPGKRAGRGYFHIPAMEVTKVTLAMSKHGQPADITLQSEISIKKQIDTRFSERWHDIITGTTTEQAPAPGRITPEQLHQINTIIDNNLAPSSQEKYKNRDSTSSDFVNYRK